MLTFPNAKINLGLHVVEKRPDGYHNIETIFYPIGLSDVLEVVVAENFSFQSSGIQIDGNANDNLVVKAYQLLKNVFDLPQVSIFLQKNIPFGAGLGGGSADAAFMLKVLNEKFELGLTMPQLGKYASMLGADCAFFLENKPAFASGIGDKLELLDFSLKGYYLVLVKPDVYVSTPKAYGLIHPKQPLFSVKDIITTPVNQWKDMLQNDFEEGIFSLYPEISEIKEKLYQSGANYASMSGSGSSVFAIFPEQIDLNNVFKDCFIWGGIL